MNGRGFRRGVCGLLLGLLGGSVLLAAPAAPRVQIVDRGFSRIFDVATNEIGSRGSNGEFTVIAVLPQNDLEGLRAEARRHEAAGTKGADLVLYEAGESRTAYSRRFLTRQVVVRAGPGLDRASLAARLGARLQENVSPADDLFILEAGDAGGALALADGARGAAGVILAEPMLAKLQTKKLLPNDPFFPNQWHLRNTGSGGGTAGVDLDVTPVWDLWRGGGVYIAIVDDGLQFTHPDLALNCNTNIDWDFDNNDADPSPKLTADFHGTACAGLAGARGNNALGVSGSAPEATLVGLRLIATATTDAMEAASASHSNAIIHVKSNSWGPSDTGDVLEGPGPLMGAALQDGVNNGRGGKGIIYVWAGGNGRAVKDNANYDGYANSMFTIAVTAVSDQGQVTDYAEPGACLVVAAPSDSLGRQGVVTTDLVGDHGYNFTGASGELANRDYTQTFGGTSAVAPELAGVVALMLQANPNLGWRDVQEILIRTARLTSPADSDWATNAAGLHFNHNFGAGLVDAWAAVRSATNWVNLPARTNVSLALTNLNTPIPDDNSNGVVFAFDLGAARHLRVEHVTLTANITHPYRGDLAITLTAPGGMQSRLAELHSDFHANYPDWTFMTVHDWAESSQGVWTVRVADLAALDTGSVQSLVLNLYGTPTNSNPVATNLNFQLTGDHAGQCQLLASDADSDPLTFAIVTPPQHGLISGFNAATGQFTYTPAHAFVGQDQLTFQANDGKTNSALATASFQVSAPADANGNGLPDYWEALYGVTNPSIDSDGDRMSNLQEYVANTQPNNSNSVLRVTSVQRLPSGSVQLTWQSVGGTRYRVMFADTSPAGPYTEIARPVVAEMDAAPIGTPGTQTFVDDYSLSGGPPAQGHRYYRIKVVQ